MTQKEFKNFLDKMIALSSYFLKNYQKNNDIKMWNQQLLNISFMIEVYLESNDPNEHTKQFQECSDIFIQEVQGLYAEVMSSSLEEEHSQMLLLTQLLLNSLKLFSKYNLNSFEPLTNRFLYRNQPCTNTIKQK